MFPYSTQISTAFAEKAFKMAKNNPKMVGKTRREHRIYSPVQRTATQYVTLTKVYKQVMKSQKVMHEVKLSSYFEEILQ